MKNLKRFLTLLLALCLALSMASFASAAEPADEGDAAMGDCCAAGTCTMPCCADQEEEVEAPPACTCGSGAAMTAATAELDASGTIGQSGLTWTLRDGILTIGGSGSVAPFASKDDQPWADLRADIQEVWFEDMGTVSIPDLAYWFTDCVNLTTAEVPNTTSVIGTDAFAGCDSLETVLLYYEADDPLTIAPGAFRVDEFDGDAILTLASASVHDSLLAYPWTADNRQTAIVDVYGTMFASSVTCGGCNCWRGTTDCIIDDPRYDGWDTYCGCPYDDNDDDSGGGGGDTSCSHRDTSLEWDGCDWYEYCDDCGDLVDSGTSHGQTVYGDWEYDSSSQHRRHASCEDCGEVWRPHPGGAVRALQFQPAHGDHLLPHLRRRAGHQPGEPQLHLRLLVLLLQQPTPADPDLFRLRVQHLRLWQPQRRQRGRAVRHLLLLHVCDRDLERLGQRGHGERKQLGDHLSHLRQHSDSAGIHPR